MSRRWAFWSMPLALARSRRKTGQKTCCPTFASAVRNWPVKPMRTSWTFSVRKKRPLGVSDARRISPLSPHFCFPHAISSLPVTPWKPPAARTGLCKYDKTHGYGQVNDRLALVWEAPSFSGPHREYKWHTPESRRLCRALLQRHRIHLHSKNRSSEQQTDEYSLAQVIEWF